MNLKSQIESLLFVASKPVKIKDFVKYTQATEEEIKKALTELVEERKTSGVLVLESNGEYQMATNPENSEIVKTFLNSDLREKLTDATVEVLSIIAYRQPISKNEIESIRGVNSQYSIRTLLMRGLIEKTQNPNDLRSSYYQTTTEFLQHMGLTSTSDLPDFQTLVGQIKLPDVVETNQSADQLISESNNTTPEQNA
jgi:segregation and condensation protein B